MLTESEYEGATVSPLLGRPDINGRFVDGGKYGIFAAHVRLQKLKDVATACRYLSKLNSHYFWPPQIGKLDVHGLASA